MPTSAQNSLSNFYLSVKFANPGVATLMSEDIVTVALGALGSDKSEAQPAADRLRVKADPLPEALRRMLEGALIDLGYS